MNYATIKTTDVANGPGIRVSLFVSGCEHYCDQCFNAEAWDFDFGTPYSTETEDEILALLAPDYIRGLSLLGGEPLHPRNQRALLPLLQRVKQRYPEKSIWCYTGYLLEDLLAGAVGDLETAVSLLQHTDVLVDGKFIAARKDLTLRFRGSQNQRVLDMPATLASGTPTIWAEL